jgi:hypothetical protein
MIAREPPAVPDLAEVGAAEWAHARRRAEFIRPLAEVPRNSGARIEQVAAALGCKPALVPIAKRVAVAWTNCHFAGRRTWFIFRIDSLLHTSPVDRSSDARPEEAGRPGRGLDHSQFAPTNRNGAIRSSRNLLLARIV